MCPLSRSKILYAYAYLACRPRSSPAAPRKSTLSAHLAHGGSHLSLSPLPHIFTDSLYARINIYSGIGLESAILFASEGASLVLVDINETAVKDVASKIQAKSPQGVRILATKADVSKEEEIKGVVDLAVKEFGRLDIMVRVRSSLGKRIQPNLYRLIRIATRHETDTQFNNAGIMHPADDNALNTEERIWDLTMNVNLKGVWWGCKHAILAMRNNPEDKAKGLKKGGSIINTASFVAIMGAATPQLACKL